MKNKTTILACAAALLVVPFLGGCAATPPPTTVVHYYSTFDHKSAVPSERVRRHGPYHLVCGHAMHAELEGHSIFHAPRRNEPEWRHGPRAVHEFRDTLERVSEEHCTHPNQPDVSDLLLGAQLLWTAQHKTMTAAIAPNADDEDSRLLGRAFQCKIWTGECVVKHPLPWHNFPRMEQRATQKHPALFPPTGKGKRLNIWVTHVHVPSAKEDPDMPFVHDIWGFYVYGLPTPWPKLSFMTFSGSPGWSSAGKANYGDYAYPPIGVDPQTGKASLDLAEGPVPLYGATEVFPNGVLWTFDSNEYQKLFGDRFAAAAIHLLNNMTDEQLDALTDEEW